MGSYLGRCPVASVDWCPVHGDPEIDQHRHSDHYEPRALDDRVLCLPYALPAAPELCHLRLLYSDDYGAA